MVPESEGLEQNEAGRQARLLLTSQVFTPEILLYIRFERLSAQYLLPVSCKGYSAQSEILQIGWSAQAAEQSEPPEPGTKVACLALQDGVLYTVKATVLDRSEGKLPRVRFQADKQCIGVNLRKHPRYEVTGRFSFGEAGRHLAFYQNVPRTINLSLGGFGCEVPRKAWLDLERVSYRLELFEQLKPADNAEPSLVVEGNAMVRKVLEREAGATVYLGCQFENLSPNQATEIELWLAAYTASQRAT